MDDRSSQFKETIDRESSRLKRVDLTLNVRKERRARNAKRRRMTGGMGETLIQGSVCISVIFGWFWIRVFLGGGVLFVGFYGFFFFLNDFFFLDGFFDFR